MKRKTPMQMSKGTRRCQKCGKRFLPQHKGRLEATCVFCGSKQQKPQTISRLKAIAWKLFSEIVRRSEADEKGHCKCVVCGWYGPWPMFHAGHVLKGRAKGILFDRRCCHAECAVCNKTELRHDEYLLWAVEKYGKAAIDEMILAKWNGGSWTQAELLELIDGFRAELDELREIQDF